MIIGQGTSLGDVASQHTSVMSNLGTSSGISSNIGIIGLNDTKIREHRNNGISMDAGIASRTNLDDYNNRRNVFESIIESFYLIETKPLQQDIYTRSYNMAMTDAKQIAFENLADRVGVKNKVKLNEIDVARTIPDIMSYSRMAGRAIGIIGGWGGSRFRFFLKLKTKLGDRIVNHYLQGFTDYMYGDLTTGKVDTDNMKLYINSIIETDEYTNPEGGISAKISKNINVINNGSEITIQEIDLGNENRIARPEDIFNSLVYVEDNDDNKVFSFTNSLSLNSKASNKFNNDGISHFTKTINAAIEAEQIGDGGISFDRSSGFRQASSGVAEYNLTSIPFIKALSQLLGLAPATNFTIKNLISIYRERFINPKLIKDNTVKANDAALTLGFRVNMDARILDSNVMHETYDASIETSMAYSIHNKICSYLSNVRFGEITIVMSNLTLDGQVIVEAFGKPLIENVNDMEFIQRLEYIKTNIRSVLFNEISCNNERPISVIVNMEWLGHTSIGIDLKSTGGNNLKMYKFPTYADALFSPVVGNTKTFNVLVQDYGNLFESIK